jgi:hypothetical protein
MPDIHPPEEFFGVRDSVRINNPVLLVFSVIFFVMERVS